MSRKLSPLNSRPHAPNPYLVLSITMVLWGAAFSSSKSVVEHVPHSVAALLRFGGAALALLVALAIFGNRAAG
ncbi:hypothetical protein GUY60_35415, partial [Streptomyces sp. YC537]|nr:hypothetical protein [Streptomyces boluensis]